MADVGTGSQRRGERDRNQCQRSDEANAHIVPVAVLFREEDVCQERQDVADQYHDHNTIRREDALRKII